MIMIMRSLRSVVLLKSNVANILFFNFYEQKFVQYGLISIAIDCNGLSLLIFEEIWPNYASGPQIRTKQWPVLSASALQCMHAGFLCLKCENFACLYTRQDQNKIHLKGWFLPKSASSVSRSVAIFFSVFQALGGGIKLIICLIRHELSVTIHEISTSWKKTLDGGPYSIC